MGIDGGFRLAATAADSDMGADSNVGAGAGAAGETMEEDADDVTLGGTVAGTDGNMWRVVGDAVV